MCIRDRPWQNINRRYASARATIAKPRVLRRQIWSSFEVAATQCVKQGGVVCWEWPADFPYWKSGTLLPVLYTHLPLPNIARLLVAMLGMAA